MAVYLNHNVNWACILLTNMKGESKKVIREFDEKGLLKELHVKKRLTFCTKFSLIILLNYERAEWTGSVEFDLSTTIPSNARQFRMSVGVNDTQFF